MKRHIVVVTVMAAVLVSTLGLAPALVTPAEGLGLVRIAISDNSDLAAIQASGIPVYIRLTGTQGSYVLAGAARRSIERLQSAGLQVAVLDRDMRGASYTLAYPSPNRAEPDWTGFGQLLHDDGVQVLLRIDPQDAARLAEAGVELRTLTLDPKPLRPALVDGVIPAVIEPDPLIQSMIDQIDFDLVYDYTGGMSGEWPVDIGGSPYTITSRYTYSGTPIQKATQFAGEHLAALGLEVEYHNWSSPQYPNVIGELPGLVNPDEIWIICGHLDDVPISGYAPGADDNASGTIATLIAADILTEHEWGSTLRFALWTGEEQGLLGSHYYAQRSYNSGENIAGVLNLDMIAWNTGGSNPDIDIHAQTSIPSTLDLAQLMADVVAAYELDLNPAINPNGIGASDHASFWDYGYPAILGIEDGSDFNPYYHSTGDDMDNFQDWPYYVAFVKAAVATFAHMSDSLIRTGVGQVEGLVTEQIEGAPIEGASVSIDDGQGNTCSTVTDATGYYTCSLLAGTYDVTAWAYGYLPQTVAGVVVVEDTVTTQDIALPDAPVLTVQGTVTELGTAIPLEAEIEFEGSPVTVWTEPSTGQYQAELVEGAYTMHVRAALHQPEERQVVVDHDQTQDFALEPLPCILLVDDDGDDPDVRPYYADALDALALEYDVWDIVAGGDPSADDIAGYSMVLWFTGFPFGNTFNQTNEASVGDLLDAGGKFFLSSQDYLYDFGLTSFAQDYLHIASFANDVTQTTVIGQEVFAGLGPYSLNYPFLNYSDVINPDAESQVAFVGNQGNAGISYEGGGFQTLFLGFPLEAIPDLADRVAVLATAVDWFGGCEPAQPPDTLHVQAIKIKYVDVGGDRYLVYATLRIMDQDSTPIEGATVTVEWTLPDGSTSSQEALTNSRGLARFRVKSKEAGTFALCVTDVTKMGYVYDPVQNGETCDTLAIP